MERFVYGRTNSGQLAVIGTASSPESKIDIPTPKQIQDQMSAESEYAELYDIFGFFSPEFFSKSILFSSNA